MHAIVNLISFAEFTSVYEAVIFLICFVSACWALVITCVLLALLFSLFYAIREFDRFSHQE